MARPKDSSLANSNLPGVNGTLSELASSSPTVARAQSSFDRIAAELASGTSGCPASDLSHFSAVDRAMADAMGSRYGDYRRATERMHNAFGHSVVEELDRINSSSATSEAEKYIAKIQKLVPETISLPPLPALPPNPIHTTNEHLHEVAETMASLLGIQAKQAEKIEALLDVQAKQAEMIDALLQAFLASTVAQNRAAKAQDRGAKRNLAVATMSAFLAFATVIVAIV